MAIVACGIALYLVWRIRGVVRLVGISLFLALALMPVVDALDTKIRMPRAALILLVYVLLGRYFLRGHRFAWTSRVR